MLLGLSLVVGYFKQTKLIGQWYWNPFCRALLGYKTTCANHQQTMDWQAEMHPLPTTKRCTCLKFEINHSNHLYKIIIPWSIQKQTTVFFFAGANCSKVSATFICWSCLDICVTCNTWQTWWPFSGTIPFKKQFASYYSTNSGVSV